MASVTEIKGSSMPLRPGWLSEAARPEMVGEPAFRHGDGGQNCDGAQYEIQCNGLAEKRGTEDDGHDRDEVIRG
jgi:hypothetical protein